MNSYFFRFYGDFMFFLKFGENTISPRVAITLGTPWIKS